MNDPQEDAKLDWLGWTLAEKSEMAQTLNITIEDLEDQLTRISIAGEAGAEAGERLREIFKKLVIK